MIKFIQLFIVLILFQCNSFAQTKDSLRVKDSIRVNVYGCFKQNTSVYIKYGEKYYVFEINKNRKMRECVYGWTFNIPIPSTVNKGESLAFEFYTKEKRKKAKLKKINLDVLYKPSLSMLSIIGSISQGEIELKYEWHDLPPDHLGLLKIQFWSNSPPSWSRVQVLDQLNE